MAILTVNLGSSSLKLSLLDDRDRLLSDREVPAPEAAPDQERLASAVDELARSAVVRAVGHRIVHGGPELTEPVEVTDELVERLWALSDLAPLHLPPSLESLERCRQLLPDMVHVACFDTAFHASMPEAASTYALPAAWRERWKLRRYGFHGLSHGYAARRAAEMVQRPVPREGTLRAVTCHLGSGASVAAVRGGRSVDTTMGFTPLEGLVMATRSGTVDPGLVLWLQEHAEVGAHQLAAALEHRSGLLAVCGTGDMREVVQRRGEGDPDATLAFDLYVHRLRGAVAAMAAAMGGVDVVVFTGGVGEHSPEVRRAVVTGLEFLGMRLDPELNTTASPDADVAASGSAVALLVVTAREDLEMARGVHQVLDRAGGT